MTTTRDLIDDAIRLAQGDICDGFKRSPVAVLAELELTAGTTEADIALEAYDGVHQEERYQGRS